MYKGPIKIGMYFKVFLPDRVAIVQIIGRSEAGAKLIVKPINEPTMTVGKDNTILESVWRAHRSPLPITEQEALMELL